MTILFALVFLSVIIVVHELGHYLAAKAVGILAKEFSIGMGPRLFKIEGKETVFSLRLLPIGGYVKFLGEEDESDNPRAYSNASVFKRILVVFSGPLMNFLLAILLFTIFFSVFGTYALTPRIDTVIENSSADKAGIQPGDEIIEVEGKRVENLDNDQAVTEIQSIVSNTQGSINIKVSRDNKEIDYELVPKFDEESGRKLIGVNFTIEHQKYNVFTSIGQSVVYTGKYIYLMFDVLGKMIFKGEGLDQVIGPVGIVGEIGKALELGAEYLINLAIVITINLGILNLIPFPALDGGNLFIYIIEMIRGKAIPIEKQAFINLAGFIVLMALMLFIVYKDVVRLF